ncbi:hypothetical protein GLYMA_05G209100v4 [Glycine max]|uniref:Uncharacterized protein n=2 Tax=Glycine subgen. Soja TaxID=1462606 RepID=A0A0R0K5D7_SOYBN|nr:uncharacterized protein LOC100791666 isoform X2 [Glycine max]XP_028233573.1 uncharacterized protein LOC114413390 isoform X2 [Glycine soja]KAH1135544.1 hypothetical protein GYH30_013331 [Glycine max]KRH59923.1 hypothetical protein GLYMA_05G209100v4 [Glycine max]RZC13553.1 hypothetical protein D0Y65_012918 [Glycine soja]|eukprot:XP_006580574.1 uncharacterized protein LOC100791666 isoform X2 [Glycine max]
MYDLYVIHWKKGCSRCKNYCKKRWGSWLGKIGCFGYKKTRKRIGHAVLVPEPTTNGADPAAAASSIQAPSITLPFVAPPSSPASFFQSEPPSTAQSPIGKVSHTCVSASIYSPGGPASIFAIGPYAHETQLVSPPVFSASSTAPFTPPPESVHMTTPSSPEVPFAQLLDPNNKNSETFQRFQISHYDFQSYQFHPGSPVGQLISPRSAISVSGTSSPLPDSEFNATFAHILDFQRADPPKLLNLDNKLSSCENQKSNHGSGSLTPDAARSTTQSGFLSNHWVSEIKMSPHPSNNRLNEISINHRVSFELSAQKVLKSLENKPAASAWTNVLPKLKNDAPTTDKEEKSEESALDDKQVVSEAHNDQPLETTLGGDKATTVHEKDQSLTLSSAKEFNFDNADGGDSLAPNIVADWWANEKVAGKEREASKDWSFFPMIQPGVS